MKKTFTLFVAALMAASTFAQVVMVDPAGKEYANGETMTIVGIPEDGEVVFPSPSVKNKGAEAVSVKLGVNVMTLPANTQVQQCFAGNCFMYEQTGINETGTVSVAAGETKSAATEWSCYDFEKDAPSQAECVIEFTIYANGVAGDKVTVIYSNNPTKLKSVLNAVKVESAYTMLGQKAVAGQKGILLQMMSDGSVRKVVVK